MTNHDLSQDQIAKLLIDEPAFKMHVLLKLQSLDKDMIFLKKFLSPSIWALIIMAAGALIDLIARLQGH